MKLDESKVSLDNPLSCGVCNKRIELKKSIYIQSSNGDTMYICSDCKCPKGWKVRKTPIVKIHIGGLI
jgi:YHS domain-containing protein